MMNDERATRRDVAQDCILPYRGFALRWPLAFPASIRVSSSNDQMETHIGIMALGWRGSVLDCGGWRGTGLTPLFLCAKSSVGKAACALAPHPPQSKTWRQFV